MSIIVDPSQRAADGLKLEAEADAWRKKRNRRPAILSGKVPVVLIPRRSPPASLPEQRANRAPSATTA